MKRLWLFAFVLIFSFSVAIPASARTVINQTDKVTQLTSDWWFEGEGEYGGGSVYVSETTWGTYLDYNSYIERSIVCEGDTPGVEYEYVYAWGEVDDFSYARQYASGSASALVTGYRETGSYCFEEPEPENGGDWTFEEVSFFIEIEYTATSSLVREKGTGSFHVPGEYNEHYSSSSVYTYGDSMVTIDGDGFMASGMLGTMTFKYHSNSK